MVQVAPGASPPVANAQDGTPRVVPRALSSRQKAAVVVRLLLNEGADIPLEELPDDLQEKLTHQLGQMGLVDRVTLDAVAQEFAEALDGIGLSFPHGLAGALDAVSDKIAPADCRPVAERSRGTSGRRPVAKTARNPNRRSGRNGAGRKASRLQPSCCPSLTPQRPRNYWGTCPVRLRGVSPMPYQRQRMSRPRRSNGSAGRWRPSWIDVRQ